MLYTTKSSSLKVVLIFVIGIAFINIVHGNTLAQEIKTVPTFECLSIYFPSEPNGVCSVFYKENTNDSQHQALDLVYDSLDREYRGSIVGLHSGTQYEIQLKTESGSFSTIATTLQEHFPSEKTTFISNQSEPLTISTSGSASGYHLVTPNPESRATIDVRNSADYTLVIDADYVIVRDLELKNAAIHGILIKSGRHHIVIESCHITFWGRSGGPDSFGNEGDYDSGIYGEQGAGNLLIQRNLIEIPRGCANNWETGHPSGPQAISLFNSTGGNIIRYNDLLTTFDHSYNDIFGGGSNYSDQGSPNRDSDIYGNIFRGCHDDAIESEGANMNVRIWGNYITDTFQHIATASTTKGPLYIFRNIFGETRSNKKFLGGSMIKTGSRGEFGGGKKFIFHNTALQPNGPLNVFTSHPDQNTMTRNNIFHCAGRLATSKSNSSGDYDFDLFTGMDQGIAKELHGKREFPAFIKSFYLEYYPTSTVEAVKWGNVPVMIGGQEKILTDPVITIANPVIDSGARLNNFNDKFTGKAPDLGAFEVGRPPLKFGRHANSTKWAAWELY